MTQTHPVLCELNETQQQAVRTTEGPVLVLAGPGSGKTRVLTHRIAYLIDECGIDPLSILAVTFTNKAAREMKERLLDLIGHEQTTTLTIGTFHSICTRFLRRDCVHLGYERDFVIYDTDDQQRLMRRILKELNLDEKKNAPRSILSGISAAKNEMIAPQDYLSQKARTTYRDQIVARCYERYQALLRESQALDFDDLLIETVRLFDEHPDVLAWYHTRYTYLLVDEYQDTNTPQYRIVRHLAARHRNLFVIGDDDQSIYAWRGADVRNILHFERDYPEAQVFTLEQNYRSTQSILDVAQAIIHPGSQNKKYLWTDKGTGVPVVLWEGYDSHDEARLVADEIASLVAHKQHRLSDCAIMYRTNAQSRLVEEALIARGLRYQVVGGIRFYERKEIKDILAYLRVVANPADSVSLLRIINVPARGIGERTLDAINRYATDQGLPVYYALHRIDPEKLSPTAPGQTTIEPPQIAPRIRTSVLSFVQMLDDVIAQRTTCNLVEFIVLLLDRIGFRQALLDEYGTQEGEDRWSNVQELLAVAEDYTWMPQETQLLTFLEEVALVADIDRLDTQTDAITCITLHQAKGLEYPVVFLIGLEEGVLPHSRAMDSRESIEEERRLFYVGITRARERLYMLRAFRRYAYGQAEYSDPSRFLASLPPANVTTQRMKRTTKEPAQPHMFSPRSGLSQTTPPESSSSTENASSSTNAPPQRKKTTRTRSAQPASPTARQTTSRKRAAMQPPEPVFQPGHHVRHHLFGEGTVLSSTIIPGDEEVVVHFRDKGEKRLLASFARLERVESEEG